MTNKQRETDFFRIGLFVIIGIVLIVVAILAFSSGTLFQKNLYVETYFNESVQGLAPGTKVKYRGIDVGHVKKIELLSAVYKLPEAQINSKYGRYVYVLLSIDPHFMPGLSVSDLKKALVRDIQEGLRVKMSLQGLTGGAYLELNFVDPRDNPALPIIWTPKYLYIPSTKSTLTRFSDSASKILSGLQDVNFQKLFSNMQTLVDRSDSLVTKANNLLQRTQDDIAVTLDNAKVISTKIRSNPSSILFSKPQVVDPSKL